MRPVASAKPTSVIGAMPLAPSHHRMPVSTTMQTVPAIRLRFAFANWTGSAAGPRGSPAPSRCFWPRT